MSWSIFTVRTITNRFCRRTGSSISSIATHTPARRGENASLSTAESAREQEIDLLRHQIDEITNAKLAPGEEEEIAARYRLAANSKRLLELAGSISRRLSEAD